MNKWRTVKQAPNGELYTCESDIQIVCVKWFRLKYAALAPMLFSIPNGAKFGGKVNKSGVSIQGKIMKAEGMTEGVPDLMLAVPVNTNRLGICVFHGLFIEMKTPVGVLSQEQRSYLECLSTVGYAVAMCRSFDEFERVVDAYLSSKFIQTPIWAYKREPKNKTVK